MSNERSDVATEVLGDTIVKGTRSAIGIAGLPLGNPFEVEMILEVSN